MADELALVTGGKLKCPNGTGLSLFTSTTDGQGFKINGGQSISTRSDNQPGINITPFAGCKVTSSGACIPEPIVWKNTCVSSRDTLDLTLSKNAYFSCRGTTVIVEEAGQNTLCYKGGSEAPTTGSSVPEQPPTEGGGFTIYENDNGFSVSIGGLPKGPEDVPLNPDYPHAGNVGDNIPDTPFGGVLTFGWSF